MMAKALHQQEMKWSTGKEVTKDRMEIVKERLRPCSWQYSQNFIYLEVDVHKCLEARGRQGIGGTTIYHIKFLFFFSHGKKKQTSNIKIHTMVTGDNVLTGVESRTDSCRLDASYNNEGTWGLRIIRADTHHKKGMYQNRE